MNKTKLSTLCLVLATSLAIPHTGWGCEPLNPNFRCETLKEKIQQSDYVFKAKFIGFGVQPTKSNKTDASGLGRYKISKIWKGNDIKVGDVIVAEAYTIEFICEFTPPSSQKNEFYHFFVRRCKEKCGTHNQFASTLNCGAIVHIRPNLDNESKTEKEIQKLTKK